MEISPLLDQVLTKLNLTNDALVKASTAQLTYKQVQKARKGKPVTLNIQQKILAAVNLCAPSAQLQLKDLFL